MIALAYLVVSILKLQPSGVSLAASYQKIHGHIVVFPQNPRPLFDMLPSSLFVFHDIIWIVWVSEKSHTDADIGPFVKVKRKKILMVLRQLKQKNSLYEHITINFNMMQQWEDEFIPTGINKNILHCDLGYSEKQGYCADLDGDNYKDDFQHAVDKAGLYESAINSNCLYTNTD